MKEWLINSRLVIAGLMVGGIAGFLYWKFVGCQSGNCMISSKPLNSTLYFSFIGAVLFQSFKRSKGQPGNK
jgi:hypothetical protein